MRTLTHLLILLPLWLTGCESVRSRLAGRPQPDDVPARRPVVDAFLHGRPSLSEERAADQPVADAVRNKNIRFGHDLGYPWQWAPP